MFKEIVTKDFNYDFERKAFNNTYFVSKSKAVGYSFLEIGHAVSEDKIKDANTRLQEFLKNNPTIAREEINNVTTMLSKLIITIKKKVGK